MNNKQFLSADRTQELIDQSKAEFVRDLSMSVTAIEAAPNIGIGVEIHRADGTTEIIGLIGC